MKQINYDFGCGNSKIEGCIGVDISANSAADIIWDLTLECPEIPTGSADTVFCRHVLEHIQYPRHIDAFLQIIRVLRVGGKFEIMIPHPGHDCAMVPDHKHWFTEQYISDVFAKLPNVLIQNILYKKTQFFEIIKANTDLEDDVIVNCYRNVVSELIVTGAKVD